MPVRHLRPTSRSVTGYRAAPGTRSIACESTLERDFVTLTLFDPAVIAIEAQPLTITWHDTNGRERRYTPDFLVERRDRTLLVEVKPAAVLEEQRDALRPKYAAARAFAMRRGWRFEISTEREIRIPRLVNAKILLDLRNHPSDPAVADRLLDWLRVRRSAQPSRRSAGTMMIVDGSWRNCGDFWQSVGSSPISSGP
jgi:hypothetical protein